MDRAPAFNLPPAVVWLGALLIAIHLLRQVAGEAAQTWILLAFSFIPLRYGEAASLLPGGEAAMFWSPVTYAFLHADALHLAVNLVWMASFGGALARRFGAFRFLLLGIISAAAGAAAHQLAFAGDPIPVVGASGAVSGMMAATARFAFAPGGPLAGGGARPDSFSMAAEPVTKWLRNRRVLVFVLVWFAVNLIVGMAGGAFAGASGPVAWQAHIGGFLAGLLVFPVLDPVKPELTPLSS